MNLLKSLVASAILASAITAGATSPERIVLIHTNDTHSHIDPTDDDTGGIMRRKVVIDSIRAAEPNSLLIDAGDAVQGSVYFTLFGGEVERKMMNLLGYDYQIMGNHELDNGTSALADQWSQANATLLSTNYDLSATPLDTIVRSYDIREIGGRRIGLIAINVDPYGLVSPEKYKGIRYLDGIKAANATAWHLRHNEKCDLIVAMTHIGFRSGPGYNDSDIASQSEDIDIIIGGHSHTRIAPGSPESKAVNASGDTILIAQTGSWGRELGVVTIEPDGEIRSALIPVNGRLDPLIQEADEAMLAPYRHAVDSILSIKVAVSTAKMGRGTPPLVNLISDIVDEIGSSMAGRKVDLALMNRGGIRCDLPKGTVTKGLLMEMLPFDNKVVLIEIKGSDLMDAFDVMASRGGDGVSSGVRASIDPDTKKATDVRIDGEPIDPDRIYLISTIDYLAEGGDYMASLTRGKIVEGSMARLYDDVISHLREGRRGRKIKPDATSRWQKSTH